MELFLAFFDGISGKFGLRNIPMVRPKLILRHQKQPLVPAIWVFTELWP